MPSLFFRVLLAMSQHLLNHSVVLKEGVQHETIRLLFKKTSHHMEFSLTSGFSLHLRRILRAEIGQNWAFRSFIASWSSFALLAVSTLGRDNRKGNCAFCYILSFSCICICLWHSIWPRDTLLSLSLSLSAYVFVFVDICLCLCLCLCLTLTLHSI